MKNKDSVIATFKQHSDAERAVLALQKEHFDMKAISIVGRGYQTQEDIVGYYTMGDRVQFWGTNGAFWGGIWGLLFGSAMFMIPGVGPLVAAGPLVAWIVGGLEGAAVVGGLSAFGAALYSVGIPRHSILEYESSIKAGDYLLIAHGTIDQIARAETILADAGATKVTPRLLDAPAGRVGVSPV